MSGIVTTVQASCGGCTRLFLKNHFLPGRQLAAFVNPSDAKLCIREALTRDAIAAWAKHAPHQSVFLTVSELPWEENTCK